VPPLPTKVLLVDDDDELLNATRRLLSASEPEWEILTACDGKEALSVLVEHSIAVVITDLCMPVLDGFGLLKHLAAHHPETIRIVHSSHSANHHEAHRVPAHRVVHKPASPSHLLTIARWAVRQSSVHRSSYPFDPR
jgi:DNA-binding NtrC family response regulator